MRGKLWEATSWLFHHNNAAAHNTLSIREFLAKSNIVVLKQPPYSPDLVPFDFFQFLKVKRVIKGTRFQDTTSITTVVTKETLSDIERIFPEVHESRVAKNEEVHSSSKRLLQRGQIVIFMWHLK